MIRNTICTETVHVTLGYKKMRTILMTRTHTFFDDNKVALSVHLQENPYRDVTKKVQITDYKQLGLSADILNTIGIDHFVQWARTTGQPATVTFTRMWNVEER